MQLGWKVMLPAALAYLMLIGGAILVLDEIGLAFGLAYGLALTAVSLVATGIFVFWLDRGRIIGGASRPARRAPPPRSPDSRPAGEARLPAASGAGSLTP